MSSLKYLSSSMNTIINKSAIHNRVLLNQNFNDFLWCNSSQECTDRMNFCIWKSSHFISVFLIQILIRCQLLNHSIYFTLKPFYMILINIIWVKYFCILFIDGKALSWIALVSYSKILYSFQSKIPWIARFFIM